MFGKILYYDKKTIDEYTSLIEGNKKVCIESYDVSNDKGVKADLRLISADSKASKSYTAKVQESMLFDCYEFEKKLVGRDDFLDISSSDQYNISTALRGYILKIDGVVSIPEQFDMVKLIDQYKPLILPSITDEEDPTTSELLHMLFSGAKATHIPIVIESGDDLLCGKLKAENLMIDYSELEEYEDTEVTILVRSASNGTKSSSKAYYDPLKDFLSLNRMMRRQVEDKGDFGPLFVEDEYKPVDILAIYT